MAVRLPAVSRSLPLYYQGIGRKERNRRAEQYLDMVGLSDRKSFLPNQLSGGQKSDQTQRQILLKDGRIVPARQSGPQHAASAG